MDFGRMAKNRFPESGSFAVVAMTRLALVIVALVSSSTLFSPSLVVGYRFERLPIGLQGDSSKSGRWRVLLGSDRGFDSYVSLGALPRPPDLVRSPANESRKLGLVTGSNWHQFFFFFFFFGNP